MTEIKSRADLFEAAAKMMRMCDEAGVQYALKFEDDLWNWNDGGLPRFDDEPSNYEFPLAIVEGKPVFKGDELYHHDTTDEPRTITHVDKSIYGDLCFFSKEAACFCKVEEATWLTPKPRTVMVELLREDAEWLRDYPSELRISEACRKALENEK